MGHPINHPEPADVSSQVDPGTDSRQQMHRSGPHLARSVKLARTALDAALVIGLAWLAARLVWLLVAGPTSAPSGQLLISEPGPKSTYSAQTDLRVLTRFDAFARTVGRSETTQTAGAAETDIAPETSLKLSLFGLRHEMDTPEKSSAIIKMPNGRQDMFMIGDELIEGVTLTRVYSTWVEISRDGVRESLFFPGSRRPTGASGTTAPQRADAGSQDTAPHATSQGVPSPTGFQKASPGAPRLTDKDFEALLASTRMVPRRNGNKITGWALDPQGSGTLFRSTGLRAGDILLAINGNTLEAAEQITGIVDTLRGAETLVLTLERGGAERIIRLRYEG